MTNPDAPVPKPTAREIFGSAMSELPYRISGNNGGGIEWRVVLMYLLVAVSLVSPVPLAGIVPLLLLSLGETRLQK